MKILVACDSFKGCMTSQEVETCIKKGIKRVNKEFEVISYPMADGGEGTAEVFCDILHGDMKSVDTVDAYGRPIVARIATSKENNIAVFDVASCIGLNMVKKEDRNPMLASSYGVGIMLKEAIRLGYKNIIIGLGGSSTNDAGMGLLSAFGVRFYDVNRKVLRPSLYSLKKIVFIDKRHFYFPEDVTLTVACDVRNHLLGKDGCTYVFGKQKGIYPNQMEEIDRWIYHYRNKMEQTFHVDIDSYDGSGAAGGIGSVLLGVMHAKMRPGIELVMELSDFDRMLEDADLVVTGEGQTDIQTLYGKVPYGVAVHANKKRVPVICLSGALGKEYEKLYDIGIVSILSSADRAMSFSTALKTSPEKIEALAYSVFKLIDGVCKFQQNKVE